MTALDDRGFVSKGDNLPKPTPLPDAHVGADGLVSLPGVGADATPIFKARGEQVLDIGHDGDDLGRPARDEEVGDMLDSGHGFLVRDVKPATPRTYRPTCEICAGPLPMPAEEGWFCQYYDESRPASMDCNCAWCLTYQAYMTGKYKPKGGRPRKRCGGKECETEAAARRQANKRARDQGKDLPWPHMNAPDGPFTVEQVTAALEDLSQPKSDYDYALTARGGRHVESPAPVWNRPRRRNEPDWWLSGQRKRRPAAPVTKTT